MWYKEKEVYVWTTKVRPTQIVETITLAAWQTVWYNNLYKQWYKIISIREQWTLYNQNTWENASRAYYNSTTNNTYWIDEYYNLGANVSYYTNECVKLTLRSNSTNSNLQEFTQVFSWYGTLNYDITITEASWTAIYNWATKTYTFNSTQQQAIKTLFAWNVYPRHRVYSQASFWQATLTITYKKI